MKTGRMILNSMPTWQEFLQTTFRGGYSATTPLGNHQWTFTDADGLRVNAVAGTQDLIWVPLIRTDGSNLLYEGDIIRVTFEQRVVTGAAPLFGIQRSVDGITWSDVFTEQTLNAGSAHRRYQFTHRITPDVSGQQYRVILGVGTATVSEYVYRNLDIQVDYAPRDAALPTIYEEKRVAITKVAGVWQLASVYANESATVAPSGNDLVITWTTAFRSSWSGSVKPISTAALSYVAGGYAYNVYLAGSETTYTSVRFWSKTSVASTPIDPTAMPDGTFVWITARGSYQTTRLL